MVLFLFVAARLRLNSGWRCARRRGQNCPGSGRLKCPLGRFRGVPRCFPVLAASAVSLSETPQTIFLKSLKEFQLNMCPAVEVQPPWAMPQGGTHKPLLIRCPDAL